MVDGMPTSEGFPGIVSSVLILSGRYGDFPSRVESKLVSLNY